MGGVLRIWAVPAKDITLTGTVVTITTDQDMVEIVLSEDTASFSEELTNTFTGKAYKVELTAIVPCDTHLTQKTIAEMENRGRYLLIFIDGNGNYKLSGTPAVPLRFSAKAATGTGSASLNHYNLSFTGTQLERAVFIDNPFL